MTTNALSAHFVDGSEAEISITFDKKRVEMTAFDEKTRQWYHLTFAKCTGVRILYSDEGDEWIDHDLTDGVSELETGDEGARRFEIGFMDESVLQVDCRDFYMEPISRPMPWE